ncbi:hypothetical protein [Cupriavidus pauculus]|uniref:Uncharacterized protein n=1 Tax=Cupriavidus pauculus TaxID=82633 RepID=A0A2N5C963_9BURK|nr:hypothetical protein [Cupriavidus pauculus]PLP98741.1 hypothetical protein CYJ10_20820 [Cupriavidus pauculus]
MTRFVSFDSAEYRRVQRDRRIHAMPSVPGAVAVHLVFDVHNYVVNHGSLKKSMAAARVLVHRLIEEFDATDSNPAFAPHATLSPITAQQARVVRKGGGAIDVEEMATTYAVIVQGCYEAIRDCDDPAVRMQAAHLLQSIGYIPPRKMQ